MKDYYAILGITTDAGTRDIKSAFRKKAKTHHPDLLDGHGKPRTDGETMLLLLEAYRTLSDPERRSAYDGDLRRRGRYRKEAPGFDYRAWLLERQDVAEYQAKLLFYDLLHDFDDEALEIYERFTKGKEGRLERFFERAEALDAEFCIAGLFEARGRYAEAFAIYQRLITLEAVTPVFGYFFEVVLLYWKRLVVEHLGDVLDAEAYLQALDEARRLAPQAAIKAAFLKRRAEILADLGAADAGEAALLEAASLSPSLPGLAPLRKRLLSVRKTGNAHRGSH